MTRNERMLDNRLGQIEVAIGACRAAIAGGNLKRMERRYTEFDHLKYQADALLTAVMEDGDAE